MPEYVAPGVHVEELPPGPRPIEGISTSVAGFVGPTLIGPIDRASDVLTNLADFERHCGDSTGLQFTRGTSTPNYMWHAARAFFENGGRRLHVAVAQPFGSESGEGGRPRGTDYVAALEQLARIRDISIVAAPGATSGYGGGYRDEADSIIQALLAHAERTSRFAVIDAGDAQSVNDIRAMRARFDSSHGAVYYPWVRIASPLSRCDLHLPPSGFVAGIYARVDAARGVYKSPANEVVAGAAGLEHDVSQRDQEVLNPEGINCLRSLRDRGIVVWGARTLSSSSEWKYVNVRRHLLYLEASIDRGTQWTAFEPNGEPLWADVRQAIENFLFNEWKAGALQGTTPQEAFFVKCDRTTMTQADVDSGRLICVVGVAPVRPAEFVIFRIGQWTADRTDRSSA